jgi:hypothetical protein
MIETSAGRFMQVALDPFWWDAYRVAEEKGLLKDVKKQPWEGGESSKVPKALYFKSYLPDSSL